MNFSILKIVDYAQQKYSTPKFCSHNFFFHIQMYQINERVKKICQRENFKSGTLQKILKLLLLIHNDEYLGESIL